MGFLKCIYRSCGKKRDGRLAVHNFPTRQVERCKLWIINSGNSLEWPLIKYKGKGICSNHFSRMDYLPSGYLLKKNAVPRHYKEVLTMPHDEKAEDNNKVDKPILYFRNDLFASADRKIQWHNRDVPNDLFECEFHWSNKLEDLRRYSKKTCESTNVSIFSMPKETQRNREFDNEICINVVKNEPNMHTVSETDECYDLLSSPGLQPDCSYINFESDLCYCLERIKKNSETTDNELLTFKWDEDNVKKVRCYTRKRVDQNQTLVQSDYLQVDKETTETVQLEPQAHNSENYGSSTSGELQPFAIKKRRRRFYPIRNVRRTAETEILFHYINRCHSIIYSLKEKLRKSNSRYKKLQNKRKLKITRQ